MQNQNKKRLPKLKNALGVLTLCLSFFSTTGGAQNVQLTGRALLESQDVRWNDWNKMQMQRAQQQKLSSKKAELDSATAGKLIKALTQQDKEIPVTVTGGVLNEFLGWDIAISGNTAAISTGAQSVYIFIRSGTGWTTQSILTGSDVVTGDRFGYSVDISGNTLVVGAPGKDADNGAAYVFVRSGTVWTQQQKIQPVALIDAPKFAYDVSISGETILIGAPYTSTAPRNLQGSAYVFLRSGVSWAQQGPLLEANDRADDDAFGIAVALENNTAVIGAQMGDGPTTPQSGSAYVFVRSVTTWSQQAELLGTGVESGDRFGLTVDISADSIVVGAPFDNGGTLEVPLAAVGSAYTFLRTGVTWAQQAKLLPSITQVAFDYFGFSVGISSDTVVVGAYLDDLVVANDTRGSAFVFLRSGVTWAQQAQLNANDAADSDQFGFSLAIDGNNALIGIPNDDRGAISDAGSARSFDRVGIAWSESSTVGPGDSGAGDGLGVSVSMSGNSAAVGAYLDDNILGLDVGAVYVYTLSGDNWSLQQQIIPSDGAPSDNFGVSVSLDADTLAVGAYNANPSAQADAGAVYVYLRTANVWSLQQKLTAPSPLVGEQFGTALALQNDRLVVGAPHATATVPTTVVNAGAVYLFERTANVWAAPIKITALDAGIADLYGSALSLDQDTFVVGAPGEDGALNGTNIGAAYAVFFDGNNWIEQQKITPIGADVALGDAFGNSVSLLEDTVAIGAAKADLPPALVTATDAGAVFIFDRATTTWTQTTKLTTTNFASNDFFGTSVSLDANLLLVGSTGRTTGAPIDTGSIMTFINETGWSLILGSERKGLDSVSDDFFGASVDLVGDWAVIGAPLDDSNAGDMGAAYFFKENFVIFADGFED